MGLHFSTLEFFANKKKLIKHEAKITMYINGKTSFFKKKKTTAVSLLIKKLEIGRNVISTFKPDLIKVRKTLTQ